MVDFYATYEHAGQRYIAIVVAPRRPTQLQFPSRPDFCAAMDALGDPWQLRSEIQLPAEYPAEITTAWLEKAAETKSLHNESTKPDSIFSFGTIPFAGGG